MKKRSIVAQLITKKRRGTADPNACTQSSDDSQDGKESNNATATDERQRQIENSEHRDTAALSASLAHNRTDVRSAGNTHSGNSNSNSGSSDHSVSSSVSSEGSTVNVATVEQKKHERPRVRAIVTESKQTKGRIFRRRTRLRRASATVTASKTSQAQVPPPEASTVKAAASTASATATLRTTVVVESHLPPQSKQSSLQRTRTTATDPSIMPPLTANAMVGSDIVLPADIYTDSQSTPSPSRTCASTKAQQTHNKHDPAGDDQTASVSMESFGESGINAPVETFLHNFRENGSEVICGVYLTKQQIRQSEVTGALSTSLPEDLFTVVDAQLSLLDEYLRRSGLIRTKQGDEVLVDGILSVFRTLWYKQSHFRDAFLHGLEECIAAANDFLRMTKHVDKILYQCHHRYPHLAWLDTPLYKGSSSGRMGEFDQASMSVFRREASDLIALYGADAVLAAQKASTYVITKLDESSVPDDLFSREWEDTWTQNEVAISMVRTFEDFLSDIHNWYEEEFMFDKTVISLVQGTVAFYVKHLVRKAGRIRRYRRRRRITFGGKLRASNSRNGEDEDCAFLSSTRAITRIMYDIEMLRDYFSSVAGRSVPLSRAVSDEMSILQVVLECLWLAVGGIECGYHSSLEEFIVVIHKRTGASPVVTRKFMSDLWLLAIHEGNAGDSVKYQRIIERAVLVMQGELSMVTDRLNERETHSPWKVSTAASTHTTNRGTVPTLTDFLKQHYDDDLAYQAQASRGCGSIWGVRSSFGGQQRNAGDGLCIPSSLTCDSLGSMAPDSSSVEGRSTRRKNALGLDLSRQGTKDLFDRVQSFQKNLFRQGKK